MRQIVLADSYSRQLVFWLAMEEYVAANLERLVPLSADGRREAFFLWRVTPTVIIGRNQVLEAEVNLDFCREHGIKVFRRKSGGGCVYSDPGNIMLSYVSNETSAPEAFSLFLSTAAEMLRSMGLDAEISGRNDILCSGHKVSGNAFMMTPTAGIVHGTMLFDSDFSVLSQAITPSAAKIRSKGVDSVRQRVANIKELLSARGESMSVESFCNSVIAYMCDTQTLLSDQDIKEIEAIEQGYLAPEFIHGRRHGYTMVQGLDIPGNGHMDLCLDIDGDRIAACALQGDSLSTGDVSGLLDSALRGCRLDSREIAVALSSFNLSEYVPGLSNKMLADCIGKSFY